MKPINQSTYTVNEVAKRYGVVPLTVYRWLWDRKLNAFKLGGHWRIRQSALDEFEERGAMS